MARQLLSLTSKIIGNGMTKDSSIIRNTIVISVLLIVGAVATVFNSQQLNSRRAVLVINEGFTRHFLSVSPKSDGLANIRMLKFSTPTTIAPVQITTIEATVSSSLGNISLNN